MSCKNYIEVQKIRCYFPNEVGLVASRKDWLCRDLKSTVIFFLTGESSSVTFQSEVHPIVSKASKTRLGSGILFHKYCLCQVIYC